MPALNWFNPELADSVGQNCPVASLSRKLTGFFIAILVDRKIRIALLALASFTFLPSGNPRIVFSRKTNADFTGRVQWRNLPRTEFGIGPVFAINLPTLFVPLFFCCCNRFGLTAIFFKWKGLLKTSAVIFDSYPSTVGSAGFNDADMVERT